MGVEIVGCQRPIPLGRNHELAPVLTGVHGLWYNRVCDGGFIVVGASSDTRKGPPAVTSRLQISTSLYNTMSILRTMLSQVELTLGRRKKAPYPDSCQDEVFIQKRAEESLRVHEQLLPAFPSPPPSINCVNSFLPRDSLTIGGGSPLPICSWF